MDISAESIRCNSVTVWCIWSSFLLRYNREKKLILMHCAIEARDPFFRPHWSLLKLKTAFFLYVFLKTFEEFNLWTIFPPCLCLFVWLAGCSVFVWKGGTVNCVWHRYMWFKTACVGSHILPATSSPNRNGIQSGDTWHGSQAQYQIQCVSLNAVQNKRSLHLVQT